MLLRNVTSMSLLICSFCIEINAEENNEQARIETLVKQLGNDSYVQREKASAALPEFGLKAQEALEQAAKSDDLEVRARATCLLVGLAIRAIEFAWFENISKGHWAPFLGDAKGVRRPATQTEAKAEKPSSKGKKKRALFGYNYTGKESAVDAALDWLAKHQEPDGHWDSKKYGSDEAGDIAQTALAILAFVGITQPNKLARNNKVIEAATTWLISMQKANGSYARGRDVDGIDHALAGIAMAEAAGQAGSSQKIITSAQNAINYSQKFHIQYGSEISGVGRAARSIKADTLTTVLFAMQLHAAKKTRKIKVAPIYLDPIKKYLDAVEDKEKSGYRNFRGGKLLPESSFAAVIARQYVSKKKADVAPYILEAVKQFDGPSVDKATSHPVTNLLGTMALFLQWGKPWKRWFGELRKDLLDTQHSSGDKDGSWDPIGKQAGMGRVATTAVNALCLEVYFRKLLIFKN